jgi:AbrB family looped-hinge helix DNA binding protein
MSSDKTAIVNEQGQILIPAVLREQLNLAPGTQVVIWREGSRLILQEVNEFTHSLRGIFGPGASLGDIREQDHRDDKER